MVLSRVIAIRSGVEELQRRTHARRSAGIKGHIPFSPQPKEVTPLGSYPVPLASPPGCFFTPRPTPPSSGRDVFPLRGVIQPCGGAGTTGPPSR